MRFVSLLGVLLLLLGHTGSRKTRRHDSALPRCADLIRKGPISSDGCVPCAYDGAICYSFASLSEAPPETKFLNIIDANVTSIEGSPFRSLSELRQLTFDTESLASISEDAFQGLERLDSVTFNKSSLTFFPPDLFRSSSDLYRIFVTSSRLSNVSRIAQALRRLQRFKGVSFYGCPMLTSVGREDLANLSGLTSVTFSGNSLAYVHPEAFDGLPALTELAIEEPNMTTESISAALANLPATSFQRNPSFLTLRHVRHPSKTPIQVDAYTNVTLACRGRKEGYCLYRCSRPS